MENRINTVPAGHSVPDYRWRRPYQWRCRCLASHLFRILRCSFILFSVDNSLPQISARRPSKIQPLGSSPSLNKASQV